MDWRLCIDIGVGLHIVQWTNSAIQLALCTEAAGLEFNVLSIGGHSRYAHVFE